jgi:tetratricopeptide (TPR) repeat protein
MSRNIFLSLAVLFLCIHTLPVSAQDVPSLLMQAGVLEKSFKDDEALQKYMEVTKKDPLNPDALCHISELYSVIGKRKETKEQQKQYYALGKQYAQKALKVAPGNSEANFAMAISMGRTALVSSGQEKIKAVREIKIYAERSVQLDPANYKGYYLIGRWNFEVSDLSSIERWLVKITFGSLPPSSLGASITNYRKSMQLNPSFILNYYELARAYRRNDETASARKLLQQMETIPPAYTDDIKIKALGKKMLDEL